MDKIFNYNFEIIAHIYAAIIWLVAFGVPVLILLLSRIRSHLRLRLIMSIVFVLGWLMVLYGSFVEPRFIVINKQSIDLPKITQPVIIALVSDLHYGPLKKTNFAKKTVKKIFEQRPDVVLIAGDIVYNSAGDLAYLEPWRELARRIPVYAVFGNHEFNVHRQDWPPSLELAQATMKRLIELGITILENTSTKVSVNGEKFSLIGLGDVWVNKMNIEQAITGTEETLARIALVHNPDAVTEVQSSCRSETSAAGATRSFASCIDLLLAGHTHGGQIRLPIVGPLGIIPTELGQKYDKGWFTFGTVKMFITSGLGETTARARLFNPPEIVLLEIK